MNQYFISLTLMLLKRKSQTGKVRSYDNVKSVLLDIGKEGSTVVL
jgi:hypothetical protein